jgi:uncharacterized protein YjiK
VQDEIGMVFIYDIRKNQIIKEIPFAGKGDFEGIASVDQTLYVLQSGGILFGINDFQSKAPSVKYYKTGIPARDNEGLCYDSKNKRLLIACKGGYKDDNLKSKQLIYSFDLTTMKLSNEPVFILDVKIIRKLVKENGIKIPGIDKDEVNKIDFRISDIAINPMTGKLFLISAADNAMIVTGMSGIPDNILPLKNEYFRQPEGITFNSAGDLFISNEGAGKKPTIVRFNYR